MPTLPVFTNIMLTKLCDRVLHEWPQKKMATDPAMNHSKRNQAGEDCCNVTPTTVLVG